MVLVDTPVWSLALRRRQKHLSAEQRQLTQALAELIREGRVQMLGPIRQELLSGIREEAQFRKLRDYLRAFPEHPLEAADYEEAAHMNNRCRARAGSVVDFLICADAHRRGWTIFTIHAETLGLGMSRSSSAASLFAWMIHIHHIHIHTHTHRQGKHLLGWPSSDSLR
jgi:predicted nucleic acid-binding protein